MNPCNYPDGFFCEACGWPDIGATRHTLFEEGPKVVLCGMCVDEKGIGALRSDVLAGRERAKRRAAEETDAGRAALATEARKS